ncbi:MAG: GNAT family N-acetyltransferase [Chitinophagales bacterium]|jgi:RimJ/RimL family protein N-acetyltransferase|nr:GNAT family N-acetyltransferase [Chitinophagales bacterium]
MIIKKYGITLQRLNEEDIELVRTWRNHPEIRKRMAYRKHITSEMQQKWFHDNNNKFNYYFLIIYEGRKIGVINTKKVNIQDRYGEGGIFIWEQELWNTYIPSLASLMLIEFTFNQLNFSNKSFIQILRTNHAAIKYNKSMGYVLIPGQEEIENQWYLLTKEDFNRRFEKLERGAFIVSGHYEKMQVIGNPNDRQLDVINQFLEKYNAELND